MACSVRSAFSNLTPHRTLKSQARTGPIMPSSAASSSISSADSEEFGAVARGGFTRMYVLSYSETSPTDQSRDYQSEYTLDDDDDSDAKHARERSIARHEEKAASDPHFQLLYSSGRHYFHGEIDLPTGVDITLNTSGRTFDGVSDASLSGVALSDLPKLLRHFRKQQDDLVLVDSISTFRSEVRDVLYQMEEVGEFLVEELAKPKIAARIEQGAHEMHWMVARDNPTFFELQTYPSANDSFHQAGVLLVVMKLVVRGVLMDVVYSRDSYYVTLRDNTEEIALEDTFIPNVSCVGPCFEVRHYSDEDLKKLILWCALPEHDRSKAASVSMPSPQQASSKVQPISTATTILDANDTQLYCLLSQVEQCSSQHRHKQAKGGDNSKKRLARRSHDSDDDDSDILDGTVVFQFNQYVYFGEVQVPESTLDDLAKLASIGFPYLRAQANDLAFYGEHEDLPRSHSASDSAGTGNSDADEALAVFSGVHDRFQEIARVLLELVVDSQSWIANFVNEVRTISSEAADATNASLPWLGDHLSRWLEVDEGMEAFFELELTSHANALLSGMKNRPESHAIDLLVWKGLVNQAQLVVIYRHNSFFLVLRPVAAEENRIDHDDATDVFGALPRLFSKGRGYLVRKFPTTGSHPTHAWLAGAKLMLWQTSASIDRETREEAEMKRREPRTASCDWFKADAKVGKDGEGSAIAKAAVGRDAEPVELKIGGSESDAKDLPVSAPKSPSLKGDRVARRHHLPRLNGVERQPGAALPPWDRRTGKPL